MAAKKYVQGTMGEQKRQTNKGVDGMREKEEESIEDSERGDRRAEIHREIKANSEQSTNLVWALQGESNPNPQPRGHPDSLGDSIPPDLAPGKSYSCLQCRPVSENNNNNKKSALLFLVSQNARARCFLCSFMYPNDLAFSKETRDHLTIPIQGRHLSN